MKKRKVKRYDEGGILRDRYGNPVRSGSGEPVRTTYPDSASRYNEEATADMVESSDYSGKRPKTRGAEASSDYSRNKISASGIGFGGGEDEASERSNEEAPTKTSEATKTFKQSFAAARRAGNKTFEFGGKRYTTEMAGSAKPSRTAEKSKIADQESEARKMGEAYKKSAYDTEKQRQARMEKEQALERVSPESALIGGGGLRAMKMLAESLAGRQAAKEAAKAMGRRMEKDITPRAPQLTNEPLKIGRESLKLGMKKGGAVKKYSSGGSVSSASKRADGIAQKGKTRGRIC